MANKKITELTAVTDVVDADLVPVVTDVATVPVTNKIAVSDFFKNLLTKTNTTVYTPTTNYHPATKKYVDDSVSGAGGGDMLKTTYDPTNINGSAFSTDNHLDGTTNKVYTALEKTKLAGIEASANNYSHPATHSADIIIDGITNKAYTATEQTKLSGIATGAEVNVNADWNAITGDAEILNKPTIPTVPVKAIGSELDTGTDDDKFLTVKSINDSHNVPLVAPSTSGNVLTSDGTDWVSSAPSGGGNTYYDILVAPSGGDYTTLTGAMAVATAGQTIFVRNGTYTEAGGSFANKVNIVGESRENTILSISTNTLWFQGTGSTLRNLTVTSTSGYVRASDNFTVENCRLTSTGTNYAIWVSGSNGTVHNNIIECTTTTGSYTTSIFTGGANLMFTNNYCSAGIRVGNVFYFDSNSHVGENEFIFPNNSSATLVAISLGNGCTFNGNRVSSSVAGSGYMVDINDSTTITNNSFINCYYGVTATYGANNAVISGNYIQANNAQSRGVNLGYASGNRSNAVITGNSIIGGGSGTSNEGIRIGRLDYATVSGNSITGMYIGINQVYDAIGCIVSGNSGGLFTASVDGNNVYGKYTIATDNNADYASNMRKTVRMKNTSGGTLAIGSVVVLKAVASGAEVTTTTTAGDSKVFGVMNVSANSNAYGAVTILGNNEVKVDGTTDIAVGDYLTAHTTAGIAVKATAGQTVFAIARASYITDDALGLIACTIITPRVL